MERIESGVVQFGDDWPGIFFRGKDAYFYGTQVQAALEMLIAYAPESDEGSIGDTISLSALRGLMGELLAADVSKGLPKLQLRAADECKP